MLVWSFVVGFTVVAMWATERQENAKEEMTPPQMPIVQIRWPKKKNRKPEEHLFVVYRLDLNDNRAKTKKR